jgi:hypothetical protein
MTKVKPMIRIAIFMDTVGRNNLLSNHFLGFSEKCLHLKVKDMTFMANKLFVD